MLNQVMAGFRQQKLRFAEPAKHGGKRKRAGRKALVPGKPKQRHEKRPVIDARFPVHVTVRVRREVTRLRRFELCKVLRRAFVYGCRRGRDGAGEFRICQFSIQGNHIHLICEATDRAMLANGMQAWAVRVARGLNGYLGRRGTVFDDRYHVEVLRSPTQIRHALCYVMQNARRHGEVIDARFGGVDPYSSAWWFDGWTDEAWRIGLGPPTMRTVAAAESWMLRVGWKRASLGLIAVDEVPPAGRRAS